MSNVRLVSALIRVVRLPFFTRIDPILRVTYRRQPVVSLGRCISISCRNMSADRVVTYEDVVTYKDRPEVLLVDVRNPDELKETGAIPSSVNIPMDELNNAFQNMSPEQFKGKYGRALPDKSGEVVFHCKMGGRATKAMEAVTALGYTNTKVYKGSMNDWLSRHN